MTTTTDTRSLQEQLAALRAENEALRAKATKATKVFLDPNGSGRIVVTGAGKSNRMPLTPAMVRVLTSPGVIEAIRGCAEAHPERETAYLAYAASFKNTDGTPKARGATRTAYTAVLTPSPDGDDEDTYVP